MAKQKIPKTNAMRMLAAAKIIYSIRTYEVDESDLSGIHAAELIGLEPDQVFKTLVARGDKTGFLTCGLPVQWRQKAAINALS